MSKVQFSAEDMILFGHFIRDNYYVAGTSELLPYGDRLQSKRKTLSIRCDYIDREI
ncbi:MAG: hypothetical protein BWX61_00037 [Bacteroidetes bacterium ADurb.Bin035]|nr:MAG: hypothetical protein BWX61_00037 [Bacteroidetes bacterium ADurb.Bin035]